MGFLGVLNLAHPGSRPGGGSGIQCELTAVGCRKGRNPGSGNAQEAQGCLQGGVKHQGLEITGDEMSLDHQLGWNNSVQLSLNA